MKSEMGLSFNELMEHQRVLYNKRFKNRITCYITQDMTAGALILNRHVIGGHRSQYLCLIILDEATDRFIALRLSTFRKILKWLTKLKFVTARRLTLWEKIKLNWRYSE